MCLYFSEEYFSKNYEYKFYSASVLDTSLHTYVLLYCGLYRCYTSLLPLYSALYSHIFVSDVSKHFCVRIDFSNPSRVSKIWTDVVFLIEKNL